MKIAGFPAQIGVCFIGVAFEAGQGEQLAKTPVSIIADVTFVGDDLAVHIGHHRRPAEALLSGKEYLSIAGDLELSEVRRRLNGPLGQELQAENDDDPSRQGSRVRDR